MLLEVVLPLGSKWNSNMLLHLIVISAYGNILKIDFLNSVSIFNYYCALIMHLIFGGKHLTYMYILLHIA